MGVITVNYDKFVVKFCPIYLEEIIYPQHFYNKS